LGQIARIEERLGPASIYREDNHRYVPVKFSIRGRALKTVLDEAKAKIARDVPDFPLTCAPPAESHRLSVATDSLKMRGSDGRVEAALSARAMVEAAKTDTRRAPSQGPGIALTGVGEGARGS